MNIKQYLVAGLAITLLGCLATSAHAGGNDAPEVSMEFHSPKLDTQGRMITSETAQVSELKVAKLVPHFDSLGLVQKPYGVSSTPANSLIFPAVDPDCFYVVIHDQGKRGTNPKIRITTKWTENGTTAGDNVSTGTSNQVTMSDFGTGDELRSPAMILVSSAQDDAYPIDGVADDAPEDRSRKISLGDSGAEVLVDFVSWTPAPSQARIGVKVKKVVQVKVYVFTDAVPAPDVAVDIARVNEAYAQVGMCVRLQGNPVNVAPPTGSNGSRVWPAETTGAPPAPNMPPPLSLHPITTGIAEIVRPIPAPPLPNDPQITIVYVKDFNDDDPTDQFIQWGEAVYPAAFPDAGADTPKPFWNIVFVRPGSPTFNLAHELGHLLTNKPHWRSATTLYPDPANTALAFGAGGIVHDVDLNLMKASGNLTDPGLTPHPVPPPSRRLRKEQETLLQGHSQATTP